MNYLCVCHVCGAEHEVRTSPFFQPSQYMPKRPDGKLWMACPGKTHKPWEIREAFTRLTGCGAEHGFPPLPREEADNAHTEARG